MHTDNGNAGTKFVVAFIRAKDGDDGELELIFLSSRKTNIRVLSPRHDVDETHSVDGKKTLLLDLSVKVTGDGDGSHRTGKGRC